MDLKEIRRQLVARQQPPRQAPAPRPRAPSPLRRLVQVTSFVLVSIVGLVALTLAGFRAAAMLRERNVAEAIAPANGRFVRVGSGRIHYQEHGRATDPPVVLIHGTAAWSELWRDVIYPVAAAGFRVIAVDVPPFGFSDRPASASYTRADQAARIAGLIDALGLSRAILVGHSFGAGPTVETVLRHPAKVSGLILVAGALGISGATPTSDPPAALRLVLDTAWLRNALVAATATNPLLTRTLLGTMIHRQEAADDRRVAVLQRPMTLAASTHDLGEWLRYFVSVDRTALSLDRSRYGRIGVRTALVWGDKDTLTPLDQAHDVKSLIPGSSLTILDGVGHIPQIEAPADLVRVLVERLREMSR